VNRSGQRKCDRYEKRDGKQIKHRLVNQYALPHLPARTRKNHAREPIERGQSLPDTEQPRTCGRSRVGVRLGARDTENPLFGGDYDRRFEQRENSRPYSPGILNKRAF
jgi:hypothetical protein